MDTELTFDDSGFYASRDVDRQLIKELVQLRQFKADRQRTEGSNKLLVAQLSDMEVRLTQMQALLEAKEIELNKLRTRLRRSRVCDTDSVPTEMTSASNRKPDWEVFDDFQFLKENPHLRKSPATSSLGSC